MLLSSQALWPPKNSAVSQFWVMAHWLKTSGLHHWLLQILNFDEIVSAVSQFWVMAHWLKTSGLHHWLLQILNFDEIVSAVSQFWVMAHWLKTSGLHHWLLQILNFDEIVLFKTLIRVLTEIKYTNAEINNW